ncbi:MAG: hypothetical protein NC328_03775 [Muribaculum sp.]|nr:hypothetical protein [Muribaculum sp.]
MKTPTVRTLRLLAILLSAILVFIVCDNLIYLILQKGIENIYGLDKHSQILAVGHSHFQLGINPHQIEEETGCGFTKYCRMGVATDDKEMMIHQYVDGENGDSIKYVLYCADFSTFKKSGISQNSYQLFYPFIDDPTVAAYLKAHTDGIDFYLRKLIKTTRFQNQDVIYDALRGLIGKHNFSKEEVFSPSAYIKSLQDQSVDNTLTIDEDMLAAFDRTMEYASGRGLELILVNPPISEEFRKTLGPEYDTTLQIFRRYSQVNPKIHFLEFPSSLGKDSTIFFDPHHVNIKGQKIVTKEIVSYLKYLEKRKPQDKSNKERKNAGKV